MITPKRVKFFIAPFVCLVFSLITFGQTTNITGKYEGTADVQPFGKLQIKATIRQKNDKLSGVVNTPLGDAEILDGSFANDVLTLKIDAGGDDVVLTGNRDANGKITGKITSSSVKGIFELKRTGDAEPEKDYSIILRQSKEKWREDLKFLSQELPKRHKNAFHKISQAAFEKSVADLDAKIPELTDDEIVLGMTKIVASIGDGHTSLDWNWAYPRFPINLFWFGKELCVTGVSKQFSRANGARLVRIGGVPVKTIYERSRAFIPQGESEKFVLNANAYYLRYPVFLKTIGAATSDNKAAFEFVDLDGKKFVLKMFAVPENATVEWIYPYREAPLYLQNRDVPLALQYLKDAKTVYVNFRWYPRRAEFRKFSDDLFAFVDNNAVEKLVIDLRNNGGGDFTRGRDFFLKQIKDRQKFLKPGRFYVLTGRVTFSAAMSNAADFRNDANAILVGEPTGGRPNSYSELRQFSLPNSHLNVGVSIQYYKFADKDTPGILPDKLVAPDWKSFFAGRDPALEWILAQPVSK